MVVRLETCMLAGRKLGMDEDVEGGARRKQEGKKQS